MVNTYLYINAALYLLLAAWCTFAPARTAAEWCTFAPARTAAAVGYASLSRSGQSEYLVIYGGMQMGVAFLFAWFAYTQQPRNGLVLALALYVPIVVYRSVTLFKWWPVQVTTIALAVVEWLFLLLAIGLWLKLRPA